MRAFGIAVVLGCSISDAASGQLRQLDRGSFVRVASPALHGGVARATLMSQRPDSLELVTEALARVTIATATIQMLDVRAGHQKSYALIGMVTGGLIVRMFVALEAGGESGSEGNLYAISGAITGAMIGSFFKREKWVRVFPGT